MAVMGTTARRGGVKAAEAGPGPRKAPDRLRLTPHLERGGDNARHSCPWLNEGTPGRRWSEATRCRPALALGAVSDGIAINRRFRWGSRPPAT